MFGSKDGLAGNAGIPLSPLEIIRREESGAANIAEPGLEQNPEFEDIPE